MIGELLKYDRGTNNEHDKHAAIDGGNLFNKEIVGHVPLSIIKLTALTKVLAQGAQDFW